MIKLGNFIDATRWNYPFASRSWQPVDVPVSHDVCYIPSERPLYEILADVAHHQDEFPTHGTDCVCMDKFSYEVRRHVARALGPDDEDRWTDRTKYDKAFARRMRVRHVLRAAARSL